MDKIILILILTNFITIGYGAEYFVSPDGNDKNPGTLIKPFRTIQKAVKLVKSGDICFIRGGRYEESIKINNLKGKKQKPIIFTAYKDEKVILDGTRSITSNWEASKKGVFSTQLNFDIWQLFYEDSMMTTARWPNAHMADENFWRLKETYRHGSKKSVPGTIYDERPFDSKRERQKEQDGYYHQNIKDGFNTESLAETGVDFTGAIAIMNIASWMSFASVVTDHESGKEYFNYDTTFANSGSLQKSARKWCNPNDFRPDFWEKKNQKNGQSYYYFEGPMCLDVPREWWFDPVTKTVYFIPPDRKNPGGKNVRGKVMSYTLIIDKSRYLHFRGIDFFGATFRIASSENITIENSQQLYPAYSKRVLGNLDVPESPLIKNKGNKAESNNRIINCRFEYTDGMALKIKGGNDIIENCLFHDIDYSCLGAAHSVQVSLQTTIRRCTVYNAGASGGFRNGGLIEYNHIFNNGSLQHDGSGFQMGGFTVKNPPIVRRNWAHSTLKMGIRFDAGLNPKTVNGGGQVLDNVTWNSSGIILKGDKHLAANNLCFNSPLGLIPMIAPKWKSTNKNTIMANNLSNRISANGRKDVQPICKQVTNLVDAVELHLRDPKNLDFRPRANSAIIDAGTIITNTEFSELNQSSYLGKAPDIGPYEFGDENYWIPGFQYPHASTPIPPDRATDVKIDADLMWLNGYKSNIHAVYFGGDREAVRNADPKSKLYFDKQNSNIFTPPELEPGETYFWRVDAYNADRIESGHVWQFTVSNQ